VSTGVHTSRQPDSLLSYIAMGQPRMRYIHNEFAQKICSTTAVWVDFGKPRLQTWHLRRSKGLCLRCIDQTWPIREILPRKFAKTGIFSLHPSPRPLTTPQSKGRPPACFWKVFVIFFGKLSRSTSLVRWHLGMVTKIVFNTILWMARVPGMPSSLLEERRQQASRKCKT
jgi:hypothetical protein